MSLLVAHSLERRTPRAVINQAIVHENDQVIEIITPGDATSLLVVTWHQPRAPRAALMGLVAHKPARDDSAAPPVLGDATSLNIIPTRSLKSPRAALLGLSSALPSTGDAPAAPASPGDATALSVIPYKSWAALRHWRGLHQNTAQDDSGGDNAYASTSDYFVQYNARLYSQMSPWLYQMTPPGDDTSTTGSHDAVDFVTKRPPPHRTRRNDALYRVSVSDDSSSASAAAMAQTTETDAAQAMTVRKSVTVVQTVETDTAVEVVRGTTEAMETDTAMPIRARHTLVIGQATETDTSQLIESGRRYPFGVAAETDTANAIRRGHTIAMAQATETDTAQAMAVRPNKRFVGQAVETDLAQAMTVVGHAAPASSHEFELFGPSHIQIVQRFMRD